VSPFPAAILILAPAAVGLALAAACVTASRSGPGEPSRRPHMAHLSQRGPPRHGHDGKLAHLLRRTDLEQFERRARLVVKANAEFFAPARRSPHW
jgi:hypothetical protein